MGTALTFGSRILSTFIISLVLSTAHAGTESCARLLITSKAPVLTQSAANEAKIAKHELAIGDAAVLEILNSSTGKASSEKVFFLGKSKRDNQSHFYFFEPSSSQIVSAAEDQLQVRRVPEAWASAFKKAPKGPFSFLRWLSAYRAQIREIKNADREVGSEHPAAVSMQNLIVIQTQRGGTCAVHSMVNCLRALADLGILQDGEIARLVLNSPDKLLNEWIQSPLNGDIQIRNRIGWYRILWSLFIAKQGFPKMAIPSQEKMQLKYLSDAGLEGEVTDSLEKAKAHLKTGWPVIFGVAVRRTRTEIRSLTGESKEMAGFTPARRSDLGYLGFHSVLCMGYIPGLEVGHGKFLILDSAFGEFFLWEEAALKASLPDGGDALLVSGGRVESSNL